jgi:PPOX class probable F420-dependent enzyme
MPVSIPALGPCVELADALAFAAARRHGVLVTQKADGGAQLSNITYALMDDVVVISVTDSRAKTKNLRRDRRASLHVTREDFYAYAVLEGEAELTPVAGAPDDDTVEALVAHYRLIAGEHPDWDEFRRTMVADRRLLVRLTPARAYGMLPAE